MSQIGEFELIGRIAAQFRGPACHPERPSCHPERPSCHPERSEGSNPPEKHLPPGTVGIGDDCAVLPQREGLDTLVTTDLLIEGHHFLLSDVTPYELGWKSAAVNISDIAAMGGKPVASFLSIALPAELPARTLCHPERSEGSHSWWVDSFIDGFRDLSSRFGVPLLGGDTSASPSELFINVTVLGECPHGRAVLRSGACAGDLICVTGPLGDSAAGLKLILERDAEASLTRQAMGGPASKTAENVTHPTIGGRIGSADSELVRRHYMPMPRVEEGIALRECLGVHAMMDISDGIASDLRHILDASGPSASAGTKGTATSILAAEPLRLSNAGPFSQSSALQGPLGAEIDLAALPLSPELQAVCAERGWDAAELAVSGGEDYELLVTMAPEALDAAREALDGRLYVIGRIVEGDGIRWIGGKKEYKGFTHF